MVKPDWNPDRRKLREFGWISLAGFAVIGLVLGWKFDWIRNGEWLVPGIFFGLGLLSAVVAMIEPLLLKPSYWLLTAIAAVIGPIVATLVLGLIFFLMFLPIGLVFAIRGRDELRLKRDRQARSYWLPADPGQAPARYFRQY